MHCAGIITKIEFFLLHLQKLGEHGVELVSTRFKHLAYGDHLDGRSASELSLFEERPENVLFHISYKAVRLPDYYFSKFIGALIHWLICSYYFVK